MSLKVWLPLNGDLENKGCSDISPELMGSGITYSAGKIGQAATFPNSPASCIHMPGLKLQIFSWACWFYVNGEGSGVSQRFMSEGRDTGSVGTNLWVSKAGTTLNWSTHLKSGNTTINLNQWYHVTLVADGANIKFYLDGELKSTTAYTADSDYTQSADKLVLGKMSYSYTSTTNYFPFNGKLNDVRVYDHALSAKEVKEISQGLVLHYKLDDPNPNLISLSTFESDPWKSAIAVQEIYKGRLAYRLANNTLYTKTGNGTNDLFSGNITYQTNTQYTLSVTWRDDYRTDGKNSSLYLRFNYTDGSTVTNMISPANSLQEWKHQSITSTAGKTVSKITTTYGNGGYLYITDLKLEIGTIDSGFAMNEYVVSDSSGYNHNAISNGSQSLTISSNSPKYDYSTQFVSGARIATEYSSNFLPTDMLTVSIWFKSSNAVNRFLSCTEGGGFNFESGSGYVRFPLYISGKGYTVCVSSTTTWSALSDNQWHMITATYDRTESKIYIDGVLDTTTASSYPNINIGYNASTPFTLGAEAQTIANPIAGTYVGNLSDCRIYCTALSAEDILDLYHTSMSIDKSQNIHSFEFIEGNTDTQITEHGQLKTKVAQEAINDSLAYDKTLYTEPDGSTWIHIFHHNNPAGSLFTGSQNDWSYGVYIDADKWYNVEPFLNNTLPYEFMIKQKTTSSAAETKYRWVQTPNPLTATWADVQPGTVTFNTTSGYTNSSYGGMYLMKSNSLHMCIANGSSGNWYGGIGVSTAYQGGIPGFPNTVVTSGYIDLYLRFYPTAKIIKNIGVGSNNLIER